MNHALVVTEARSYLGTRWQHQGRTQDGVDCLGLLVSAFGAAGWRPRYPENIRAFASPDYRRQARGEEMLNAFRAEGEERTLDETLSQVEPGDIAVFRFQGDEYAQHCGIVTERRDDGALYVIHADSEEGRVVEHRLAKEWRKRLVGAFCLPVGGAR